MVVKMTHGLSRSQAILIFFIFLVHSGSLLQVHRNADLQPTSDRYKGTLLSYYGDHQYITYQVINILLTHWVIYGP